MKIRVGFGYDVHAFVADRELWLGGIRIEHSMGLQGHSDADVLIHAICDALLGAANMRDIGYHFPDTAEEYEGIDSKVLLYETMELLRDAQRDADQCGCHNAQKDGTFNFPCVQNTHGDKAQKRYQVAVNQRHIRAFRLPL